jgi:hypothetical protein
MTLLDVPGPGWAIQQLIKGAAFIATVCVAASALIVFAVPIARAITPKFTYGDNLSTLDEETVARVSLSIIGVGLVAFYLPKLLARWAEIAYALLAVDSSSGVALGFSIYSWPNAVVYFFGVGLGIALFLTAFRIAPLLRPLRRAGTSAHLDEPTSSSQNKERS